MGNVTFPEPDVLEPDQTLSDDQKKIIQDIKSADWNAEGSPEKTPKKEEQEELVSGEKTPEELETERKAQEAETAEKSRLEQKSKELGKTVDEVRALEAADKAEQERLEKIAKEENRTVEEVKAEEAKDKAIVERHGNDSLKIARALRKEQSEYGKLKAEADQLRKMKEQLDAEQAKFNEQQFEIVTQRDKEKIIAKYREKFPTQADGTSTEELSDDACFERGKVIIRDALKSKEDAHAEQIKAQAETKRMELIKTLPEEFKDFVPEVKKLLSECEDSQILDPEFDIGFLAKYARGEKFSPEYIKSLEEAAYKRGVEQAKIIPTVPGGKPQGGKRENLPSLSDSQKRRAEEIYGRRDGWTKQQMWDEYAKNDLKSDSEW